MKRTPTQAPDLEAANGRLTRKLWLVTLAMFGFGFALVPLYDVFCQITGLNGKTGRVEAEALSAMEVDESRWVTVEFTGSVNSGMPWEFKAKQTRMRVHPGATYTAAYYVRNTAAETIIGQAVPSVTPGQAASHFKKIECFCFDRQELKAGETKEMPVRFVVDRKLAPDVSTVTLSYTFFNVDAVSAKKYGNSQPAYIPSAHQHAPAAVKSGA